MKDAENQKSIYEIGIQTRFRECDRIRSKKRTSTWEKKSWWNSVIALFFDTKTGRKEKNPGAGMTMFHCGKSFACVISLLFLCICHGTRSVICRCFSRIRKTKKCGRDDTQPKRISLIFPLSHCGIFIFALQHSKLLSSFLSIWPWCFHCVFATNFPPRNPYHFGGAILFCSPRVHAAYCKRQHRWNSIQFNTHIAHFKATTAQKIVAYADVWCSACVRGKSIRAKKKR